MPRSSHALPLLLVAAACSHAPPPDAYGNVDVTPVVVSAETAGRLLTFTPAEGDTIGAGREVAVVDTVPLLLQRNQVAAQRDAGVSRIQSAGLQIGVLNAQRDVVQRAYQRTQSLYNDHAATAQQLDKAELDYRTLLAQIAAATAQRETAVRDTGTTTAQIAQIHDQIRRSHIRNPIDGTVLATYVKPDEFVQPGEALYRIASLDTVDVRAYVTETQLAALHLGSTVTVTVDTGQGVRGGFPGTVSWIASQAEFTPTPIQTRDERATLVYAIKVRVPNPRRILKIGMPVDVRFGATASPATGDTAGR